MESTFGSDFISISDEDGNEYELEVLTSVEYNGSTYLAVIPVSEDNTVNFSVSILRSTEEDGEPILCAVEDENEMNAVETLIMDSIYEED